MDVRKCDRCELQGHAGGNLNVRVRDIEVETDDGQIHSRRAEVCQHCAEYERRDLAAEVGAA